MPDKKPYDSTLVRVAGNIASGMCAVGSTRSDFVTRKAIAKESLELATEIIRLATEANA
jgi:hypothetical protein